MNRTIRWTLVLTCLLVVAYTAAGGNGAVSPNQTSPARFKSVEPVSDLMWIRTIDNVEYVQFLAQIKIEGVWYGATVSLDRGVVQRLATDFDVAGDR